MALLKYPLHKQNVRAGNRYSVVNIEPNTGVYENKDHRHKEQYIAICISYSILWVGTHIAIYRSLLRWSLFLQTPVGEYRGPAL